MRTYFDPTEWSTRQLITLLAVIGIALAALGLSGCADTPRMHPMLKRTLDDQARWGHGGP